jgi:hypothetical protein
VVGTFIFEIFTSIGVDMLITGIHRYVPSVIAQPAYFDTVKKILELAYSQAVIWFGVFFCPLLPVIGILRCFVLYHVQRFSTNKFCSPKGTPFTAKHSLPGLIWMVLAFHLMIAAVPSYYFITNEAPSGIARSAGDSSVTF